MLKNLVLFRHGKAQRPYDAPDDFSRELTDRGRTDSQRQALRLREAGFVPDIACVSTALRASQTWDCAAPIFPNTKTLLTRELYHASADTYLDIAKRTEQGNIVVIAHDPGLHELCRYFLKGSRFDYSHHPLHLGFPTAGIAWFRKEDENKSGFELIEFFDPLLNA